MRKDASGTIPDASFALYGYGNRAQLSYRAASLAAIHSRRCQGAYYGDFSPEAASLVDGFLLPQPY